MASDPKLLNVDAVEGFYAGANATAVIVTLQPPAEAAEFATQSELSPNHPEALTLAETLQRYVNVYHHHLLQPGIGPGPPG